MIPAGGGEGGSSWGGGGGGQATHFFNGVCKEDNKTGASFQVASISSYPCLS